jgi:hypothetical protein
MFLPLFLLHVLLVFVMGGVMWFVQLAYYPNLAVVGREAFVSYQREHIRRITRVAWTLLTLELTSGIALVLADQSTPSRVLLGVNLALILITWWSTWCVQVPLHKTLEQGWDEAAHARLVGTNWLRTVLYTIRGALILYLLWMALAP